MTSRKTREQLVAQQEVVQPPSQRACTDQTFELPTGIYVAMATMFAGFITVLALAFNGSQMAVPYGVIFAFLAAFFGVPALFPRMAKGTGAKASNWYDFRERGIMTATGHSTAREATTLVLLLPCLILFFGIAVATIAAWR